MSDTLDLASALISLPSVTPVDGGCQNLIAARLAALGFKNETMQFEDVTNLWSRLGDSAPLLVFVGHTDVVPTGPVEKWISAPFTPTIRDGFLYGRGSADMKANIAAFITALERLIPSKFDAASLSGSIALMLTSDEEGPGINGVVKVVEELQRRQQKIDYCIVGEPSSVTTVGDTVKNGRRGSLNGRIYVNGIQGHAAYPQRAINPIHTFAPALAELCAMKWDEGNQFFPPTSFQVTNVNAGTGADNVICGSLEAWINFRFSTESTPEQLKEIVEGVLKKHKVDCSVVWKLSGQPFLTATGNLLDVVQEAIVAVTGTATELSTSGGTSDGRFIAPTGAQVIELGLVNDTIHKIDECVRVSDLDILSSIYERIIEGLLAAGIKQS
jgi:succinyl-diaminopimelate desuccinylase